MADPLAHRPRRDLRLPRWLRSASAQRREGGQRAGAGCGRCPLRRAQTPARSGAVRRGVVCGVERLPRRSRGAWPASSGALHYRREPRAAYAAFERTWAKRCPGVVTSLREGGNELFPFFTFPKAQWKTRRSTNVIERLHGEFRRRVKTQGSLPSEDAALILLFSLVASGQIRLRRIDGWRKIAAVLSQPRLVAA